MGSKADQDDDVSAIKVDDRAGTKSNLTASGSNAEKVEASEHESQMDPYLVSCGIGGPITNWKANSVLGDLGRSQ